MKRVGLVLLVLLVGLWQFPLGAEGPDDRFLRIYGLILQGDALTASGRTTEAREAYRVALEELVQFEKAYPRWNQSIIQFRRQYLQERAGTATNRTVEAPSDEAAPGEPPPDPKVASLLEETKQLKAERDILQAKLREALSAQPAGVDPRELAAAGERIATLQKDNQALQATLTDRERQLVDAIPASRLTETERALADARRELLRQTNAAADQTREITSLRQQLQAANERTAVARPPAASDDARQAELNREIASLRQQLQAANERAAAARPPAPSDEARQAELNREIASLRQQLQAANERAAATAHPPAESEGARQAGQRLVAANVQIAELTQRTSRLEQELSTERERSKALQEEKLGLEKRATELSAQIAAAARTPPPTSATPTNASPITASPATPADAGKSAEATDPKREKALAKYQREVDRTKIQQLERERDELNRRVRVLNRQLEDIRRQAKGTNTASGTDQLAILRARLEAYEARAVPYSTEELGMMQQTAPAPSTPSAQASGQRQLRQIPAGAATLLADAQRAFVLRRYPEAENKLEQALRLDDRNSDMLTYLAAAQLEQDRFEPAEANLKRALEVDALNPDGVSLMGLLRFRQARYDEAFDLLSQAAQLNPDNPYTQNYLGVTLNQRGQRKAAETALRRAISLDPKYGEAHANLAAVYALQKPPFLELARWHYEKALALGAGKNAELEKLLAETSAPAGTRPPSP